MLIPIAPSYAMGFGMLMIKCHLNEKFDASVPLLLSSSETMNKVRIELASPGEYRQMGLTWSEGLKLIRVETQGRDTDSPFIKLTSPVVMTYPLLSIVLKASSEGHGVHYRHYQIFLDPSEMPAIYKKKSQAVPALTASEKPLKKTNRLLDRPSKIPIAAVAPPLPEAGVLAQESPSGDKVNKHANTSEVTLKGAVTETVDVVPAKAKQLDANQDEVISSEPQAVDVDERVEPVPVMPKKESGSNAGQVKPLEATEETPQSQGIDYWMVILFVLLTSLLGVLIGRRLWGKKEGAATVDQGGETAVVADWASEPEVRAQPVAEIDQQADLPEMTEDVDSEPEALTQPVIEIDALVNNIEEGLSHCNYEQVEQLLVEAEQQSPDSLRLAALKAQLYHETERYDLRDALINSISESSDKQHWESFCKILPIHVWNGCFGDGSLGERE